MAAAAYAARQGGGYRRPPPEGAKQANESLKAAVGMMRVSDKSPGRA
jgi:hypothetical protein